MKSLKNKLFEDLKLENTEIVKVIGGRTAYSSCGSDTNPVGGGYDMLFATCENGQEVTDSVKTDQNDSTTVDKPTGC